MTAHPALNSMIRIGTRGSRLARWQADWVAEQLRELNPGLTVELGRDQDSWRPRPQLTTGRHRRSGSIHQGDSAGGLRWVGRCGGAQFERPAYAGTGRADAGGGARA